MEKSGRIGGIRFRRGLLSLLAGLGLVAVSPLSAVSGPEEPLAVIVRAEDEPPTVGESWDLVLLVDHPNPAEVSVRPPDLPAQLVLDRVRTGSRLVPGTSDREERWTEITFHFTPVGTGNFTLGPFEVFAPGKSARTAPMALFSGDGREPLARYQPRLRWSAVPDFVRIGEAAELLLVVDDGNPDADYPAASASASVAPAEGSLAEALPPTEDDIRRGAVLRLRLRALEAGVVALPRVSVSLDGLTLAAPYRTIPVREPATDRGAGDSFPASSAGIVAGASTAPPSEAAAWPNPEPVPPWIGLPVIGRPIAGAVESARDQWSNGAYAAALAGLRAAERDLFAGPVLRPLRRALEAALGHNPGPDEWYGPVRPLLALIGLLGLVLLVSCLRKRRCLIFSALGLMSTLYLGAIRLDAAGYLGRGRAAVLLRSEAHKVPDTGGVVAARFAEGVPVRILTDAGAWVYIESSEGVAGWIASSAALRY